MKIYYLIFHNLDEFKEKIDYFLKSRIRNNTWTKDKDSLFLYAYRELADGIWNILRELDLNKYNEFNSKYYTYFNNHFIKLPDLEEKVNELLKEYAMYIIPLSNNKIPFDIILKAGAKVKKEVDKLDNESILNWIVETSNINSKYEKLAFPYKYDPNNKKEAYLESIDSEENKHIR